MDIGGIVDHHCFTFSVFLIFMEILTITVLSLLCLVDIGGIVDQHCLNFLLLCWYWRNCWLSLFKLSFVLLILEELLTITVSTFFCFVDIGGIVDHHCFNFLLFCWYWWNYCPSLLKISFPFVDIGRIVDLHWLKFLLFCWNWRNCWLSLSKLSFVLLILQELLTITF